MSALHAGARTVADKNVRAPRRGAHEPTAIGGYGFLNPRWFHLRAFPPSLLTPFPLLYRVLRGNALCPTLPFKVSFLFRLDLLTDHELARDVHFLTALPLAVIHPVI